MMLVNNAKWGWGLHAERGYTYIDFNRCISFWADIPTDIDPFKWVFKNSETLPEGPQCSMQTTVHNLSWLAVGGVHAKYVALQLKHNYYYNYRDTMPISRL
jgi:hypothetical protein